MEWQQKHIKGLALLVLMMFGALSIMAPGCSRGGDSDDDGTAITKETLVATWDITATNTQGYTQIGTISLNADGALSYEIIQVNNNVPAMKPMVLIGTGIWTLDGSLLTMTFNSGVEYQGPAQGDNTNFSVPCSNGWTISFDLA